MGQLCTTLDNIYSFGPGMEPVLIRVAGSSGAVMTVKCWTISLSICHFRKIKEKEKSRGILISGLQAEAYFLINDNVTSESLFRK